MNRSNEERQLSQWLGFLAILCWLALGGCVSKALPYLPCRWSIPGQLSLNLTGIDQYQSGQWMKAFESFDAALQIEHDFVEAHFNAALALHQMGRYEQAIRYFQRAGELAPQNKTIINSTLYRNHLGLSSTFERHMSGGYRY
ncbi:MAG: tetratricopeptide repeat protein [Nitrospira sp.]|nr:tetratricopeptide repeat protein [Nitrospira sp.]